jgi:sugar phosphate isomerase/epimerase
LAILQQLQGEPQVHGLNEGWLCRVVFESAVIVSVLLYDHCRESTSDRLQVTEHLCGILLIVAASSKVRCAAPTGCPPAQELEMCAQPMTTSSNLQIGFNARLFPINWRPVREEIQFGAANGFVTLQLPGKEEGLSAEHLGDDIKSVRRMLEQAGMSAVMEIVAGIDEEGYTATRRTPVEILAANLPAIAGLPCRCVHFHFVQRASVADAQLPVLERRLTASLDTGAGLGKEWGFQFGLEHNERAIGLFATPQSCAAMLAAVPRLAFVWDVNHTHPDDFEDFAALLPRVSTLHISDTRLPETNEHLPLGMGNIDFANFCGRLHAAGFEGPAILEIGGLPKSGGYGRDTDSALVDSLQRLRSANEWKG